MLNKEKKQGIVAGISLIIMAVIAAFSLGYAHAAFAADSPEATLQNLVNGKALFYAELSGWSLIFIADVVVAIALYYFFRSVSKQLSLVTAMIRIVYSVVLGAAILQLFRILPVLSATGDFTDMQNATAAVAYLAQFEKLWSIGLIVFGFHLVGLGILSLKSRSVHRILGYLLVFGGISYSFIHGTRQLNVLDASLINSAEKILALPMALAEILLAIWLIYNGFRKTTKK